MTDKNRFSDLVSGIKEGGDMPKTSSQSARQPSKRTTRKNAKKQTADDQGKAPYQKSDKTKVPRGTDNSLGKSKNPNYDKITVYISADVAHALRVFCAVERREMSELVEGLIRQKMLKSSIGKETMDNFEFEQSDN